MVTYFGKFSSFPRGMSKTSPLNVKVLPGAGYIVMMTGTKTVTFTGTEWEVGKISLSKGLNLISVPLNPGEWRLSDLMEHISPQATMITAYDTVSRRFLSFPRGMSKTSPLNVQVKGGAGYIVMMADTADVIFEGIPWEN